MWRWALSSIEGFSPRAGPSQSPLVSCAASCRHSKPCVRISTTALKAGARDGAEGRGRMGSALLAGQVALTFVLLIGAGLFVRSLRNVLALDLGVDIDHVLRARAWVSPA